MVRIRICKEFCEIQIISRWPIKPKYSQKWLKFEKKRLFSIGDIFSTEKDILNLFRYLKSTWKQLSPRFQQILSISIASPWKFSSKLTNFRKKTFLLPIFITVIAYWLHFKGIYHLNYLKNNVRQQRFTACVWGAVGEGLGVGDRESKVWAHGFGWWSKMAAMRGADGPKALVSLY